LHPHWWLLRLPFEIYIQTQIIQWRFALILLWIFHQTFKSFQPRTKWRNHLQSHTSSWWRKMALRSVITSITFLCTRCILFNCWSIFLNFFSQIDNKRQENPRVYLKLPSTYKELEKVSHPGIPLKQFPIQSPECSLVLNTNDSFMITTEVCSTKITHNGEFCLSMLFVSNRFLLLQLISWDC
jgi:hypothetical protein